MHFSEHVASLVEDLSQGPTNNPPSQAVRQEPTGSFGPEAMVTFASLILLTSSLRLRYDSITDRLLLLKCYLQDPVL